ncbi:MAG: heme ABC exporter ATP-binding protein CcmA [Rhodospirillaceae bacterium]|nr:heme ABC exporter ATP-binding protein CcmA [Rhodospirillaceae bacterium]MBT4114956.1 heme ABC exporter ATP-binding protein CcmA [Rhodospirillaceae bacterium]MBT4750774.1 heme ABC exporter ATP-binding protein CcmA [Rhodospirillaceae bacterium]MBT5177878.1 heme ABC exporter ATP-binding protein CcmA [Rhodospirillaceae bacterium]MBT6290376.1 heme ABC exporter ATP-binding protein CcmA [Rhodospirillaceae bacterium]
MGQFSGSGLGSYRGQRMVFRGLDFAVGGGDLLHLVGPNGSGKSTLLRVMAGLLPVIEGQISWDGAPVAQDRDGHRARLIYLGHADAIKGALSVFENLAFWCTMAGGGDAAAGLARFNLAPLADLPARFLSAGQRRRLNLARLAAIPAALWLLDEPAASLDTASEQVLEDEITRHRAAGGLVVMASHGRDPSDGTVLELDQYAANMADFGDAVL